MKLAFLYSSTLILGLILPLPTLAANLSVPFTSQAPAGNWVEPWQNACEESVILMVDAYYRVYNFTQVPPSRGILNIFYLKESYDGMSLDEDAAQMVDIINRFLHWEAYIVENPTLAQIKQEIDAGRPVIVPVYGRGLRNPNFQGLGPDYHTVVVSGYDNNTQEFITQEPGTSIGKNYRYSYSIFMNAIHDFVPGKTATGPKRVIFTRNSIEESANLDGDADGATKALELQHGTLLHDADTDNDGFSDGLEIQHGYSPLLNEYLLASQRVVVKSGTNPAVYLLDQGKKRHIANEAVFIRQGWRWRDITIVSDRFLHSLETGPQIR